MSFWTALERLGQAAGVLSDAAERVASAVQRIRGRRKRKIPGVNVPGKADVAHQQAQIRSASRPYPPPTPPPPRPPPLPDAEDE